METIWGWELLCVVSCNTSFMKHHVSKLLKSIPFSREQHGFEVKNSSCCANIDINYFKIYNLTWLFHSPLTGTTLFWGWETSGRLPIFTSTEFFGYTSKFYVLYICEKIVLFCNELPHPNKVGIQTLTKSLCNLLNKSPCSISFCLCLHS